MTETTQLIHSELFTDIMQLSGGRNNRVFRATGKSGDVVIKQYFYSPSDKRDRLVSEFSMLSFLHENGICNVPKPHIKDEQMHTGIYGFIDGSPVNRDSITENDVAALAELLCKMWHIRALPQSKNLPLASDACFSIKDYAQKTLNRINSLCQLSDTNRLVRDAVSFVKYDILPFFISVHDKCCADILLYESTLDTKYHALSPSDHGFHNAIRSSDGMLYFIDFEYSGWDDPVKMICDPLLQPDNPVPAGLDSFFIKNMKPVLDDLPVIIDRFHYIYTLLSIKWCCILLNEFMPASESRRNFSGVTADDNRKNQQLQLSRNQFEAAKYHYEHHYIANLISELNS